MATSGPTDTIGALDAKGGQDIEEDTPAHSSGGGKKSKSRRKRARLKKKQLKKAQRKKRERKERERSAKGTNNDIRSSSCNEAVSFTPNHIWLDASAISSTQLKGKAGPRDCYDECLAKINSTRCDTRVVIFSWLNELKWYNDSTKDVEIAMPMTQNEHVDALMKELGDIKNRLWPAAVRCAAAHNANNFDQRTPDSEFVEVRRACNQFEWLGEGQRGGLNSMFVNRSAIKIANIDALLNFSLISVREDTCNSASDPFVFVDLCAAPGGFSEYIMYRCETKEMPCRGYAMSLTGKNENGNGIDWKFGHTDALDGGATTCTSSFRVCGGADGTGDIYKWENIASLRETIAFDASKRGQDDDAAQNNNAEHIGGRIRPGLAHLVVADGGFDVQRDSSCQEVLAQRIIISQTAAALELLRPGGNFLIKMFGHQTIEMRRLVKYLSQCFEKLTILKPVSSRPASAERYLVCISFSGMKASWDGRTWMGSITCMLSSSSLVDQFKDKDEECQQDVGEVCSTSLENYLDTVDADIARLNVKSCSRIASYLEAKAALVEAGDRDGDGEEGTSDSVSYQTVVDTHVYKHAWQLR